MPGCIVSATTASFRSVEKRRRRATPVITSTFENVSDIGVCLGLYLGPPAKAGVRSKRGAVHCPVAVVICSALPGCRKLIGRDPHRRHRNRSAALSLAQIRQLHSADQRPAYSASTTAETQTCFDVDD